MGKWKYIIPVVLLIAIFPTQSAVFCAGVTNAALDAAGISVNGSVAPTAEQRPTTPAPTVPVSSRQSSVFDNAGAGVTN